MKDFGIVIGSFAQAKPIVVGKDTVYIHTDITPVQFDVYGNAVNGLYQYHEIQYDKDEYIGVLSNEILETEANLIEAVVDEFNAIVGEDE